MIFLAIVIWWILEALSAPTWCYALLIVWVICKATVTMIERKNV